MLSSTLTTYQAYDPALLDPIGEVPNLTASDVDRAVELATEAQLSWAADLDTRRVALREVVHRIRADADRLARLVSLEQGKDLKLANVEVAMTAAIFEYYANFEWSDLRLPDRDNRQVTVQLRPYGVVAAVTPWNYPLSLLAPKVAPALIAGNTVIAKPAATTALCTVALVDLMNEVLPEGVLQCVTSNAGATRGLASHPGVAKVSVTGSGPTGQAIMRRAADRMQRVTLELGGNDPAIVTADVDIPEAARRIAASAFRNAGQTCISIKRVFVDRSVESEFTDALAGVVSALQVGHGVAQGTDIGPVHTAKQRDFVIDLIDDAVRSGARIVTGGDKGSDLPGHFVAPTVVTDIDPAARLVVEEQFGPVLPVVAFDGIDTAIELANAGPFGLGSSIWSADLDAAYAIAERINAGTVWINQHTVVELDAPFGGWKESGLGRERGAWGLNEYLQTRTVNVAL
ncbi:aldehyde dehydrogenase family protein [Arthrobacter sulfonylureivorans]|uniref:Aldehyde dehydrogenase family protein n=1 Tax=Arthrobacter sulfonylureivorans TaxID=2486855 RepID=A0ABY3WBN1_9MICC|nr:aldehyde dehydrogenase family protein [Arthrobacter sulfonylureivorans]UNK47774.1 aldehyde dehydrogenase family protein [Arthrobacter sulfonylureivorans]